MHRLVSVAMLAACTSLPSLGWAQLSPPAKIPSDARTDQARDLHLKGAALYEQGLYDKAEAAFLAAWALKKHYQIAGNLGACEMKLGHYRDAAEHLAFFLREQPPTGKPEERRRAQALFEEARAKVGTITLTVSVPGAVVSIDGREIGAAPLPADVYVDPGARTLVATHGSYRDAKQIVEVTPGGTQPVTLALTALDGPPSPPPLPPPKRSVVPGALMAGIGGAALVTGIGLFAGGRSKRSSISALSTAISSAGQLCVAGAPTQDSRCGDLHSQATTANALEAAGIGLMIGGSLAAVGGVIYFVVPSSSNAAKSGALRILPALSPSSGELTLSGSF